MGSISPSARTGSRVACVLLVLLAAASPVVGATDHDPVCDATPECSASFTTNEPCGVNLTADGRTCVHRSHLVIHPADGMGASVDEEDATGNVNLTSTPNTWTAGRLTVAVAAGDEHAALTLTGLVGDQDPAGPATTRQASAQAAGDGLLTGVDAGVALRMYDGHPRWCMVTTPVGDANLDCSVDPLGWLLP